MAELKSREERSQQYFGTHLGPDTGILVDGISGDDFVYDKVRFYICAVMHASSKFPVCHQAFYLQEPSVIYTYAHIQLLLSAFLYLRLTTIEYTID